MNGSLLIKSTGMITLECDGYFAGTVYVNDRQLGELIKASLPDGQGRRSFTGDLMLTICQRELSESSCDLFEVETDA